MESDLLFITRLRHNKRHIFIKIILLVIFSSKDQINVIRKASYQITISDQIIELDECISEILTKDVG